MLGPGSRMTASSEGPPKLIPKTNRLVGTFYTSGKKSVSLRVVCVCFSPGVVVTERQLALSPSARDTALLGLRVVEAIEQSATRTWAGTSAAWQSPQAEPVTESQIGAAVRASQCMPTMLCATSSPPPCSEE
eukprot:1702770-Rhodomonas_salina.1